MDQGLVLGRVEHELNAILRTESLEFQDGFSVRLQTQTAVTRCRKEDTRRLRHYILVNSILKAKKMFVSSNGETPDPLSHCT
jgi:hypothetical protein